MSKRLLAIVLIALSAPLWAQGKGSSAKLHSAATGIKIHIHGAGSTTASPLFGVWIEEYTRLHPGVHIAYQSIGSGAGFRLLTSGTTFFAATDVPISDAQLAQSNRRIVQIPIALKAIVPVYNLEGDPRLSFSGNTLADIFLGKITKWDDPAIATDNPGVQLPSMEIKVLHEFPNRSPDAKMIADYLAKVSPDFRAALANSKFDWRLTSRKYCGCSGTSGYIPQTPGSISSYPFVASLLGYRGMSYAEVKNAEGEFVAASPESITAAADAAMSSFQAPDFRLSLTNAPGKNSYPITSFIWLLMYEDPKDKKQKEVMIDFVKWVLTDGQKLALKRGFPALPDNLVQRELQQLD